MKYLDQLGLHIEGVSGGYILTYDTWVAQQSGADEFGITGDGGDDEPIYEHKSVREVHINARKLMKRVQELLEQNVGNK